MGELISNLWVFVGARLWQSWPTTRMLSTGGRRTSLTGHWHCCSLQGALCKTRVNQGAWSRIHLVLVWHRQGGSSPFQRRLHVEEHAGQQADQPPPRTLRSPHALPPYPPGQSIHHHHQCVCSHTHSRPCDQRGLLQQLKVPPLKSRQQGQAHHHGQL